MLLYLDKPIFSPTEKAVGKSDTPLLPTAFSVGEILIFWGVRMV